MDAFKEIKAFSCPAFICCSQLYSFDIKRMLVVQGLE